MEASNSINYPRGFAIKTIGQHLRSRAALTVAGKT
jgi:hypothetical protein